jgi:hypothetical protein
MAVTTHSSATSPTALTVNVASSLATITTAGTYQLYLDMTTLAGGATPDILFLREYVKTGGATTKYKIFDRVIGVGGQSEAGFVGFPRMITDYYEVEIVQTQGTGRVIPWKIVTA